ncbi:MAG: AAA family ATPase, partial [Bacillota bacterium]|nr:AAA family ATPase [Bacillota bacterium]
MSKLSLIIADNDEEYLNGVVGFLTEKYLTRFKILSFTDKISLINYIEGSNEKLDILLVSPDLYYENLDKRNISLLAILSSGRLEKDFKGCDIIYKYQLGENLAKNILNLYSDKNCEIILTNGEKTTKVVAVFSPNGGSGKTSVAYGCSLKSVQRGKKAFYLNLEGSASTPLLFETDGQFNLSHVFYYLKSKNKSFSLKIEGIRMIDKSTGIHYFAPPKNHLELLDIEPDEYSELIAKMKEMRQYDVIFIDMPCFLEKRMISVLKACDVLLCVLNPENISLVKLQNFLEALDIIDNINKSEILSKTEFLINKAKDESLGFDEVLNSVDKVISYRLPKAVKLYFYQNGKYMLD